jgi:hypothetical protein
MRIAFALVLLLVRLEPLAGAALCLVESTAPAHECGSEERATPQPAGSQAAMAATTSGPAECPLAVFCAPGAPVVLSFASAAGSALYPDHRQPSLNAVGMHPGDPTAPPIPPPIA